MKIQTQIMTENHCYLCQEPKVVVGHDTQSCPNVLCKNCGQKGHILQNCQVSKEKSKIQSSEFGLRTVKSSVIKKVSLAKTISDDIEVLAGM